MTGVRLHFEHLGWPVGAWMTGVRWGWRLCLPQVSAATSLPLTKLWGKMSAGDQHTQFFTELAAE
eukprot:1489070-Alexandrium_andersonii.AAC.1